MGARVTDPPVATAMRALARLKRCGRPLPPCSLWGRCTHIRRRDMFGSEAKADDTCRNALQPRPAVDQTHRQGWPAESARAEYRTEDLFLDQKLKTLRGARRESPPTLHVCQSPGLEFTRAQGAGK